MSPLGVLLAPAPEPDFRDVRATSALKAHNGTKSDNARFLKGANYGSHGTLFDHVVSERQQIG
jgi:hypothetical protein